jgi:hypothetical protein
MVLENKNYVPTLAIRASEMNGLEFLPGATKDRMTPCFLLAPWANSNSIDRSIVRIERAFPNRPYFLDIDPGYEFTNLENEAQRELRLLMDPQNCYANWASFVGEHDNIWPCIQHSAQSEAELRTQIASFQEFGRPYCLRLVRDRLPANLAELIRAVSAAGSADFAVILEGGWTRDPLSLAGWFNGIMVGALNEIDATVPIVLSCTSIPDMFTAFSGEEPTTVPFANRQLVDDVIRNTNRARIIYGDWGSTRPRQQNGFANRPLDRVDYPTERAWLIARNKEDQWDFRDAAIAILDSSLWNGNLGIWGEEMIQNTSVNKELGIDTPQKNVAARVNIHLHRQAFYGQPPIDPSAFDEEWQD